MKLNEVTPVEHTCVFNHVVEKKEDYWVMSCQCGKSVKQPPPRELEEKAGEKKLLLG